MSLRRLSEYIEFDAHPPSPMFQVYIAFRLYGIWDQRKSAIKVISVSFILCYAPFLVFGCIAIKDYVGKSRLLSPSWSVL